MTITWDKVPSGLKLEVGLGSKMDDDSKFGFRVVTGMQYTVTLPSGVFSPNIEYVATVRVTDGKGKTSSTSTSFVSMPTSSPLGLTVSLRTGCQNQHNFLDNLQSVTVKKGYSQHVKTAEPLFVGRAYILQYTSDSTGALVESASLKATPILKTPQKRTVEFIATDATGFVLFAESNDVQITVYSIWDCGTTPAAHDLGSIAKARWWLQNENDPRRKYLDFKWVNMNN